MYSSNINVSEFLNRLLPFADIVTCVIAEVFSLTEFLIVLRLLFIVVSVSIILPNLVYEGYRSIREFQRENENTIDTEITELLSGESDYWNNENSNKNPRLNTTQRDYLAGIVSKDASRRYILPPEIVQAHDDGLIHVHDLDYLIQYMNNCCLINLEDMLQNGTVISETLIEKPHSFSTACTVATQIIAQVASSQYGGQSISLAHLAPFVDISRQKIKKEVEHELCDIANTFLEGKELENVINKIAEERLKKEIEKGIQTIQYQITTLMTTNG